MPLLESLALKGGKALLDKARGKVDKEIAKAAKRLEGKTDADLELELTRLLAEIGEQAGIEPKDLAGHLRAVADWLERN